MATLFNHHTSSFTIDSFTPPSIFGIVGNNSSCGINNTAQHIVTSNSSETYSTEVRLSLVEKVIEASILSAICIAAVVGNVSLWLVVLTTSSLRNESNTLILCLSLADLLVSVVSMPVTVVAITASGWTFSKSVCTAMGYINMLAFVTSVESLGMISVNRYVKICRPALYVDLYTTRNVLLMCVGVWFLSATMSLPPFFGWARYSFLPFASICFCDWAVSWSYAVFMIGSCFCVPCSIMTICYISILRAFRQSRKVIQAFANSDEANVVSKGGRGLGSGYNNGRIAQAELAVRDVQNLVHGEESDGKLARHHIKSRRSVDDEPTSSCNSSDRASAGSLPQSRHYETNNRAQRPVGQCPPKILTCIQSNLLSETKLGINKVSLENAEGAMCNELLARNDPFCEVNGVQNVRLERVRTDVDCEKSKATSLEDSVILHSRANDSVHKTDHMSFSSSGSLKTEEKHKSQESKSNLEKSDKNVSSPLHYSADDTKQEHSGMNSGTKENHSICRHNSNHSDREKGSYFTDNCRVSYTDGTDQSATSTGKQHSQNKTTTFWSVRTLMSKKNKVGQDIGQVYENEAVLLQSRSIAEDKQDEEGVNSFETGTGNINGRAKSKLTVPRIFVIKPKEESNSLKPLRQEETSKSWFTCITCSRPSLNYTHRTEICDKCACKFVQVRNGHRQGEQGNKFFQIPGQNIHPQNLLAPPQTSQHGEPSAGARDVLQPMEFSQREESSSQTSSSSPQKQRVKTGLTGNTSQRALEKRKQEEFRLSASLLVVIVLFIVCWFPYCISMSVSLLSPEDSGRGLDMTSLLLGYLNSCVNPIVYGLMNRRFKDGYRKLFAKHAPRCKRSLCEWSPLSKNFHKSAVNKVALNNGEITIFDQRQTCLRSKGSDNSSQC